MMTILFSVQYLFFVLVLLHATNLAATATLLPPDEVDALKEIAKTLGKSNWDINADPCDVEGDWGSIVTCENSTDARNKTVSHIISIILTEQSLNGTLPSQLFRLPSLRTFDVSRNYLNGTIPKEWGSTKLYFIGYMAPEYAMHGYLTDKADIYSFGIVALEVVSGRSNSTSQKNEECFYLLDWVRVLKERGNLIDLVDQRLGCHFDKEEALVLTKVALMCTNATPALRPPMSSVVSMLEGKVAVPVLDSGGAVMTEEKIEAMRKHFRGDKHQAVGENITKSMSIDGPWIGTTSSASNTSGY